MPRSSATFAISLGVDPADLQRLVRLAIAAGLLCAAALLFALPGPARLAALGPPAGAIIAARHVARLGPLPDRVAFDPETGWMLVRGNTRIGVRLLCGSWFSRHLVLAGFADSDGRQWLVPLVARSGQAPEDWRRLRVLWRTRRRALVAESSNC